MFFQVFLCRRCLFVHGKRLRYGKTGRHGVSWINLRFPSPGPLWRRLTASGYRFCRIAFPDSSLCRSFSSSRRLFELFHLRFQLGHARGGGFGALAGLLALGAKGCVGAFQLFHLGAQLLLAKFRSGSRRGRCPFGSRDGPCGRRLRDRLGGSRCFDRTRHDVRNSLGRMSVRKNAQDECVHRGRASVRSEFPLVYRRYKIEMRRASFSIVRSLQPP